MNYTYEDGKLTFLNTPSTEYSFLYGNFGLRDSIKAGAQTLASYSYTDDRNHYLERLDYGNGDSVQYTYDDKGRLTTEVYEDGATVEYAYNSEGERAQVKDSDSGITRKFFYDLTQRMGEYTETGSGLRNRVRYTYT